MPTRIVIPHQPSERFLSHNAFDDDSDEVEASPAPVDRRESMRLSQSRSKTPIRGVVGLRSTVKEEKQHKEAKKNQAGGMLANAMMQDHRTLHLSSNDLRASPRLPGYLYMSVTSIVMLVSAVTFYVDRDTDGVEVVRRFLQSTNNTSNETQPANNQTQNDGKDSDVVTIRGTLVLTWKLYGAVAFSAAALTVSLLILFAHFDTVLYPKVWKKIFRDGSKHECYLLIGLIFFWAAGLHICTSSLSVGEAAPNVFFTTWIAFASACINMGVWRTSAEKQTLADVLWSHPRETIHNWFFVFVFSTICALSLSDAYANRENYWVVYEGQYRRVAQNIWMRAFCVFFGAMGLSILTMACCHCWRGHARYGTICGCTINLDWRQPEGFIALSFVGVFTWVIIEYTGVNFPLSGPSNAYFGAWGVFFSSILTFGTWMRENKHIELIIDDSDEEEDDESNSPSSAVVPESARKL